MKTKKRILPALVLSLFAGAAATQASAQQAQFSNVVVFGDSLSDAGYFRPFLTSLGLPAATVAQLGRFTTNPGPVFSELISTYYGVTPNPSNVTGGSIFAQGGARVALPGISPTPGIAERPVSTQVTEFLSRNNGVADPNALYTVWAGANDIFQNLGLFSAGAITQAQLQANVLAAANAEIGQIARLQAAGARYVVVFGLPDIGATPQFSAAGAATQTAVTALSGGYNTTLFTGLAGAGIRVIPVDAYSLLAEVRANPATYGFTNVTGIACGPFPPITTATTVSSQFCLVGANVVPNGQNTYLFADGVHPTSAAQAIVAQFVESLIEGPTGYSLLAEVPLRTRQAHVRTIREGLGTAELGQIGRLTVFAAGDGGNFDVNPSTTETRAGAIGVTARVSEGVVLGLSIGKSTSEGSFGNNMGGFDTNETVFSAFASAKWGGLYGNAIVSVSDVSYTGVHRSIVLGPAVRTATSRPEGSNSSIFANLGYDFAVGRFKIGPVLSIAYQDVDVNQFDEAEAGSANLRIYAQSRKSEVWSAGVRASFDIGRWTPWAQITADKERKDGARVVTASPLSMASGNNYDVPAIAFDNSYMTGSIGIRGMLTDSVGLSLAYYKVSGRSNVSEDGLTGMVSIRF